MIMYRIWYKDTIQCGMFKLEHAQNLVRGLIAQWNDHPENFMIEPIQIKRDIR